MRTLRFISVAFVLVFASLDARAILPDSGWYWNPAESGRGFNIEVQNSSLFIAGFIYDANGAPIWITSGGPMSSDRFYSGPAYVTSGGQCVGCAYHPPSVIPYGSVSVTFTSTTTATITVNGIGVNVTRQQFGIDLSDPVTPLLGEWSMTTGQTVVPVYFGERISLNTIFKASSGTYAAGARAGETTQNLAVGNFGSGVSQFAILLDSSTSYYNFFVFSFTGLNLIEGTSYVYLKGSNPTSGLYFVGHRIKSAQAAAGGNRPGTGKSLEIGPLQDDVLQHETAIASETAAPTAGPEVIEAARALEAVIRQVGR